MKKLFVLLPVLLVLVMVPFAVAYADTIPITSENLSQLEGKWEGTREVTTGIYAGTSYATVLIFKGQGGGELLFYDIPNMGILSYSFSKKDMELQEGGSLRIKYEGDRNGILLTLLGPDSRGRLGLEGPWEGTWVSGVMKLRKK